jgi:hypothetical protein
MALATKDLTAIPSLCGIRGDLLLMIAASSRALFARVYIASARLSRRRDAASFEPCSLLVATPAACC